MAFPTIEQTFTFERRFALLPALACAALMLIAVSFPSYALRGFPANAQRGVLESHEYPYYKIGTTTYRMAAGGKIFNQQNMIVMPVSLPAKKADVMYRLDMNGQLSRLWLLTAEEAARIPRPTVAKPAPVGKP